MVPYELFISASGRIRTLNPQSRNLVFYPVELRTLLKIDRKDGQEYAKIHAFVK